MKTKTIRITIMFMMIILTSIMLCMWIEQISNTERYDLNTQRMIFISLIAITILAMMIPLLLESMSDEELFNYKDKMNKEQTK